MKQLLHVQNIILGAVDDDGDYAGDGADNNYDADANCDYDQDQVCSQKKKRYYLGIFPNMGGGVFPNPKTFVNLPSIFLYAKFILRC